MNTDTATIDLLPQSELVKKMAKDLYFGNGQPALFTKVALQEEATETIKTDISDIKRSQQKFTFLLLGTLLTSSGALIAIVIELLRH